MSKKTKTAPKKGKGKDKSVPAKTAPKAKAKTVKEVLVKKVVYSKSREKDPVQASTGSRFKFGTAAQAALEVIVASAPGNEKEVRTILANHKKDNGTEFKFNLDSGYFTFVVASHPEHFQVMTDGSYKVTKKFAPDTKALKEEQRLEHERQARKEKGKPAPKKAKAEKPAAASTSKPKKGKTEKVLPPKKKKNKKK